MERLLSCEFNMDTACVELKFVDGSMISIDTIAVENEIADNMYQRSELDYLIYNDPIAYHPAERPIEKPKGFDSTYYPPDMEKVPRRLAIVRANRYVVDHVDYLIAYAWHSASNARELAEYAQKRERKGLITVTML